MNKMKGFTLIELVVVIVILGILAVTAAPKFLNLQSDARISALNGLKGAVVGASSIVYGKAATQGKDKLPSEEVEGIDLIYGYPEARSTGLPLAMDGLSFSGNSDWDEAVDEVEMRYLVTFKQDPSLTSENDIYATNCYVQYQQATSQAIPVVTVIKSGC
ncbi:type II secretion system protein [Vibrio tapetis]|uniref:Mannose-sensitive hemagglutinin a n=1 Tax=Vibrio tapetis subsp. tapetis TaxID=1671868 RepID=A0A2N8ZFJ0_9VIBR|nr:prepilin-type N-terminal cleavage/methylation domain-containing protein [Vibrio tapetis]SON50679.1 Mannose-sensitive hemagglutinin a [Vibrio tapetis subsp. tapetis]